MKKPRQIIHSYEEFVKKYYPKTWKEILNPKPIQITIFLPRPRI